MRRLWRRLLRWLRPPLPPRRVVTFYPGKPGIYRFVHGMAVETDEGTGYVMGFDYARSEMYVGVW